MEDAKTELQEMSGNGKADVAVGIIPTIAADPLPKLLKGFAARHPLVSVKIIEDITPIRNACRTGTIDMAIAGIPSCRKRTRHRGTVRGEVLCRCAQDPSPCIARCLAELNREPFLLLKEGHALFATA